MEVEKFFGGIVYRDALRTEVAQKAARIIRAFYRYDRSLFFKPPINDVLDDRSHVRKAWVQYPKGEQTFPSIAEDYQGCEGGWGSASLDFLKKISENVDSLTNKSSKRRFIQVYPPESILAAHHDHGISSKIIGLSGIGVFTVHDPIDIEKPLIKIPLFQGDVLHFYGNGLHSAANVSPYDTRYTLNLIDEQ